MKNTKELEMKKRLHSLRSYTIRHRLNGESDTKIINSYSYFKGYAVKDVVGLFKILLESEKIPHTT